MKVLLINGSPNEKGCTFTALSEFESVLNAQGIATEILHIGNKKIPGCMACRKCTGKFRCVIDDIANTVIEKAEGSDGFVFGSPVYYAAANSTLTALLTRSFFAGKPAFAYKPGTAVVSCRRGGAASALDQLNKYFTINNMPLVPSQYWNMVHGNTPDEVRQDLEGMQTMRTAGKNMAWLLKCIAKGRESHIDIPVAEAPVRTNFI